MRYLISVIIGLSVGSLFALQGQQRPNVIVIVADDLGNSDVGYHQQSSDIPTPNIDALAKSGIQFTSGYVTAPVCGPSRAGLLTGCYQQRFGFDDNPGPFRAEPNVLAGIPPSVPIIPEYLKPMGYNTACIGKWHVGHESDAYFPTNRGFDYFFGFLGGAASYYPGKNEGRTLFRNTQPVLEEKAYITDAFGREAVEYIEQANYEPFFMYLAFNAVHGPLQDPPAEYLKPFLGMPKSKRRTLCAMQYAMDINIGKLIKALDEKGIRNNTLLFFVSDNGGKIKGNYSYNKPYRGEKGTLYEGGVRLPFCVSMPGTIPEQVSFDKPVNTIDILPTIMALVNGSTMEELDGHDLQPFIKGEAKGEVHNYMYWRINQKWAIRNKDWKLVLTSQSKQPELFHISHDISESIDLYQKEPRIAKQLQGEYDRWSNEVGAAQWGWNPKVGKYVKHPHEDFESINTEQLFTIGKTTNIDFVSNPKAIGINKSKNVLEIKSSDDLEWGVKMKVPQFQLKEPLLKFKVLVSGDYEVTATLKSNKIELQKTKEIEQLKQEQWQNIIFDFKEYKGAVNSIQIVFNAKGETKQPHTLFIDEIGFGDK